MAGDLAPVYAPVGGGAAVGVLATFFAEVAAAPRSSIAASVSMACTVAAIHSTCSTADRNKSHETISNAAEQLTWLSKAEWMEATVPRRA